jgi:flagellar basal body-associated protein FliL
MSSQAKLPKERLMQKNMLISVAVIVLAIVGCTYWLISNSNTKHAETARQRRQLQYDQEDRERYRLLQEAIRREREDLLKTR